MEKNNENSKKEEIYIAKPNESAVFYAVNPISGAKEGRHYIEIQKEYFNFRYDFIKESERSSIKSKKSQKSIENVDQEQTMHHIYIYNLTDKENWLKGIETLKKLLIDRTAINKLRFIIGGGDGSVLSIVEYLINEENIDLASCVFGVVPLGTGNDLSNTMGYGAEVSINSTLDSIISLTKTYIDGIETKIDVWKAKISLDEKDGMIIQHSSAVKETKKDSEGKPITVFRKSFINYLSLGYDARVGFGFEKNRSSYRCWNKFIYFWEGCKKSCCRKTLAVKGFIKNFKTLEHKKNQDKQENSDNEECSGAINPEDISVNQISIIEKEDKAKSKFNLKKVILLSEGESESEFTKFESGKKDGLKKKINIHKNEKEVILEEDDEKKEKDNEEVTKVKKENEVEKKSIESLLRNKVEKLDDSERVNTLLKGDPVALICQNVNFYMGGTQDIWKKSGDSYGVEILNNKNDLKNDEEIKKTRKKTLEKIGVENKQSYNDKKLEFFSYNSGITMGFEKVVTGLCDKVYQGSGPFIIEFKSTPKLDENDKTNRVYMNIDGEYYHLVKPFSLKIVNNKHIFGGQLPFLRAREDKN